MQLAQTIVALSTPQGTSALATIRLSGSESIAITQKVWKGKNLEQASSHTLHYGHIIEEGFILDEVMVAILHAPKTFTKENLVEITCHGNMLVVQSIINALVNAGAMPAKAGEFTQRAFLNGRIDLSQAEAVADLIHAESKAAQQAALNQMRGGLRVKLQQMRSELLDYLALIELELDFGEEDVEFAKRGQLADLLTEIISTLSSLSHTFKIGNAIKNGIPVVIAGKPNAGKSTLLNALLKEEKAIVSSIAGTTRDIIEDQISINGYLFRFIDTAGLRQTTDEIEAIGVQRARDKMAQASLIIYLEDLNLHNSGEWIQTHKELQELNIPILLAGNKSDLISEEDISRFEVAGWFVFSANQEADIEGLKELILQNIQVKEVSSEQTIITNQRHHLALENSIKALSKALQKLQNNSQTEILAADLREGLQELGSITGDVTNEDILGSIFSRFCIGK